MSVLFLGKANDSHASLALQFCQALFPSVDVYLGDWGQTFPDEIGYWRGDLLVSYQSRWIVPKHVIEHANVAVNFHPGPPTYRGIGCVNMALYDGAAEYGATAHHITPEIDGGAIIAHRMFALYPSDTVETVLSRTYTHQLALFYDVIGAIHGGSVPVSDAQWSGRCWTRKDLDALATLSPEMSADEIRRRIRATSFGTWKPTMTVGGVTFRPE